MKRAKQQRRVLAPATTGRSKRRLVSGGNRPGPAVAGGAVTSALVEGVVHAVDEAGVVAAILEGGQAIAPLCPAHIDRAWLRAAAARAPVAAVFAVARPSGRYVLWGVFPAEVHADVRADVVVRGRHVVVDAESVRVAGANGAQLNLDPDGNASLRGRDITSHARRVNRIKGGAIRLN